MRLQLEARPQPSQAMTALSPVIAIGLTVCVGAVIFAARGLDPLHALYVYFVEPVTTMWSDRGAHREGGAAGPDRRRPRGLLPGQPLEHRGRGPVHGGRDRGRRRTRHGAGPRPVARASADAGAGHARRHGVGGGARAAQEPVRSERDPDQPDAGVRRPVVARLAGARSVAGPSRLQLPEDGGVPGLAAPADARLRAGCTSARCSRSSRWWCCSC